MQKNCGYNISHYYTLATNADGTVALTTADDTDIDASNVGTTTDMINDRRRIGYNGYLLGVEVGTNGAPWCWYKFSYSTCRWRLFFENRFFT